MSNAVKIQEAEEVTKRTYLWAVATSACSNESLY
jgi:hypothetical protein